MVSESATNKIELWLARCGMFDIVGYVIGWGILGMCIQPFMTQVPQRLPRSTSIFTRSTAPASWWA